MKKTLLFMVAGAAILFTACNKELEVNNPEENQENGPVYITANIDPETKSTLNNGTGAFAFSNGDAIMVCNNSGAFSGTTTSTENSGTFVMADGFIGSTDGIAGFPASLVSAMTNSTVTFSLPTSYEYSEVGGTDPSAAKVPCPMIGSYDGETKKVTLKQAGAVVRFRVTNVLAGSLSFVFETNVTGQVKLNSVPSGLSDGILTANLSTAGSTITINNVPTVTEGYIFITIPVPTGTVPNNILVTNEPSDASDSRFQSLSTLPVPGALNRAGGYKISVSPEVIITQAFTVNPEGKKVVLAPGNLMAKINEYNAGDFTATASEWKFGGYFEVVGGANDAGNYLFASKSEACRNKWVDLFSWQGEGATIKAHGLVTGFFRPDNYTTGADGDISGLSKEEIATRDASISALYFGTGGASESVYSGCWDNVDGGITITNDGGYRWRVLSSSEWSYIVDTRTTKITINGNVIEKSNIAPEVDEEITDEILASARTTRVARVSVAGVNGLLVFPDVANWVTETMGTFPKDFNGRGNQGLGDLNYTYGLDSQYTSDQMVVLANAGFVFLPCTGFRTRASRNAASGTIGQPTYGYYWTDTGVDANSPNKADYLNFNPLQRVSISNWHRFIGRAVRLARDI